VGRSPANPNRESLAGADRHAIREETPLLFGHKFYRRGQTQAGKLQPTPAHHGHIAALDGIRGLAILLVTVYRFAGRGQGQEFSDNLLWNIASHGTRGVDLFFVLSGFLITGILYDAKGDPHYFRNFYARRALRIFPLYYAMLVVTLILLPLVSTSAALVFAPAREHQAWLWLYGTNLLQSSTGTWPFGCLDHFWSLAVEEHFYFVWPLVIYWLPRRAAIGACVIVIASAFVSRVGFILSGGNQVAPEVFTLFRADALAMGGLVALIARGPGGIQSLSAYARHVLLVLGPILLLLSIGHRRLLTIPDTFFAAFFAGLLVTALTANGDSQAAKLWNSSWLRFFGKYSYAMYVFQYPLIPLLTPILSPELLTATTGNATAARLLYVVVMTAITTAAAIASWTLFEKRFLSLKKYFEVSTVTAQ
jgi:peptidoglycan/LPS O-acetylase OafA/YrhL